MSMNEKTEEKLERISCIWYPITFKDQTKALLNSKSKINAISQTFAQQLGLKICKTNIGAQKIDSTTLKTYKIVVFIFSVSDKDDRKRFFEESFLLADVKPNLVLGMPFLTMSNTNVDFQARDLQWRSYITGNILLTTRQVELIGKTAFAPAALDQEHEVLVVHVAALSIDSSNEMHPSRKTQIAHPKADEAFSEVPSEYADFADVFCPRLAAELLEHTEINNHAI